MARARKSVTIATILLIVLVGLFAAAGVLERLWTRLRPGATLVLAIDSAHPFDEGVSRDEARRRTLDAISRRLAHVASNALVVVDGDRILVQLTSGQAP